MANPNVLLRERYSVAQLLGKGGMGEVYLAEDTSLGRKVAVKKVLYSGNEVLLKAAAKEALVLARLQHHGLPRVLDCFNENEAQYIVMEYIAGQDLGEMMRLRQSPFPVEQVLAWASPLMDILDYLHSQSPPVVHRDIKPANIKITDGGKLFLLDFGLVKDTPTRVAGGSLSASVYGYSQSYAPLEQINGDPTSVQTDIYGLCATLYHLLTNVKPPDALDRATRTIRREPDSLRPAHEVNPSVPPALSQALEEGLRLNCEERVRSVQAMRQLLAQQGPRRHDRIHIDLGPAPAPNGGGNGHADGRAPAPPEPAAPRRHLKLYAAVAASFVVLLLASVFGYRWWQQSLFERLAREQLSDAQAIERSEGLLSQSACLKYRGVASDALDVSIAKELVRKLNDCTSAQSLLQEAEKAEREKGLNAQTVEAYRKIVESYPGSTHARQADKKVGEFERIKQATLKAWKEMQEVDNQIPEPSDNFQKIYEAWTKYTNQYQLIGREDVDPDLSSHILSQISAFNEMRAALDKRIKDGDELDARVPSKKTECSSTWFPDDCFNNWARQEHTRIDNAFNTQATPIRARINSLAEADKAIGSRLAEKYKVEFKDL